MTSILLPTTRKRQSPATALAIVSLTSVSGSAALADVSRDTDPDNFNLDKTAAYGLVATNSEAAA